MSTKESAKWPTVKATVKMTANQARVLSALSPDGTPETAIQILITYAHIGATCGGSHELETVRQIFGEEWEEKLRKSV